MALHESLESGEVRAPRYDLTPEEAQQLCQEFISSVESGLPDGQFGCYVISADSKYSNLGRFVESTVFAETFNNTPELMDEEYSPYDKTSDFYVVIDQEKKLPIGAMRVIKDSEAGLKSLEDLGRVDIGFSKQDVLAGYGLDQSKCVDVSTLAVLPDYRGSKLAYLPSLLMYRTLYLKILSNPDYDASIAMIDEKAERGLNTLKFPFQPVFDSDYFPYLDSEKSHLLIAKNSMFHPQLTYWVNRLKREAGDTPGAHEELIANTIDALINPRFLDPMLADSVTSSR